MTVENGLKRAVRNVGLYFLTEILCDPYAPPCRLDRRVETVDDKTAFDVDGILLFLPVREAPGIDVLRGDVAIADAVMGQ